MTRRSPVRFRSAPRSYRVHILDLRNNAHLTTKPETVIKQIEELPEIHSKPLLQFKDWLIDEEDSMLSNAANYLRVLKLFCLNLDEKEIRDVTREDVLEFLDKRKKSIDVDPKKKWVRSKTVTKEIPSRDDGGTIKIKETITTEDLAEPHLRAITLIKDCAAEKVRLVSGDVIRVSAKKWSIQRIKDMQRINELTQQLREEVKEKSK